MKLLDSPLYGRTLALFRKSAALIGSALTLALLVAVPQDATGQVSGDQYTADMGISTIIYPQSVFCRGTELFSFPHNSSVNLSSRVL